MIDNSFRRFLPAYLDGILRFLRKLKITPNQLTFFAFLVALASAYFVFIGYYYSAIVTWWFSRFFDACDGIYARKYSLTSNFGAYLDIQLDMAAYSLMVIAFSLRFPEFYLAWMLMLFFYVLCVTGALSLGNFETQLNIKDSSGRGLRLASGLAEGGETGLAYTLFLLFPHWLNITTKIWLAVLLVTVIARLYLAFKILRIK